LADTGVLFHYIIPFADPQESVKTFTKYGTKQCFYASYFKTDKAILQSGDDLTFSSQIGSFLLLIIFGIVV